MSALEDDLINDLQELFEDEDSPLDAIKCRLDSLEYKMSIVRDNLMTKKGYTPYCGGNNYKICGMPRTVFNGEQFECKGCGWKSRFDKEFIETYKREWGIK